MNPVFEMIPSDLKDWRQWVLWRYQRRGAKWTKPPYCPATGKLAQVDHAATWGTFDEACRIWKQGRYAGLAFVLCDSDPYTVIDLDHCAQQGKIALWAHTIVDHFASYTEWSPSRQGLHIWLRGRLPGLRRRKEAIELYDAKRCFTLTGWHLTGTPEAIEERQEELERSYWHLFKEQQHQAWQAQTAFPVDASDDDLVARAMRARNGTRFAHLWTGDTSVYAGDRSRADLALCGILAFWCAGDAERVDRLFRQSGLYRAEKWDQRHFATGETYGQRTIAIALAGCRTLFSAQERG
jgi:putative DNA primase/helicase